MSAEPNGGEGQMSRMIEVNEAPVAGRVARGFERVARTFAANFANHGEVGAACAVYHRGECIVDLWGGVADTASGRPWQTDTIALMFSAAKGPTAVCVNRLAEQGRLDVDLPVAHYWPEFGCNGKQAITTRMVLSHRAGLAAVAGDLTLDEVLAWDPVVAAIAAQSPVWEPGSAHGYHARSFGWILGELVRRVDGRTIGRYLAEEIAGPLGLHLWIGLPDEELARCATLIPPTGGSASVAALLGSDSLTAQVMTGPSGLFGYNEMWNLPKVLAAEMPSSNGVGDARSLARFYAALVGEIDGICLLGQEQLRKACQVQSRGPDKVIFHETSFGLGLSLQPMVAPGAGPNSFGHPGAGGAMGFADPDAEIAFAYIMNAMHFDPAGDARAANLIRATYDVLAQGAGS